MRFYINFGHTFFSFLLNNYFITINKFFKQICGMFRIAYLDSYIKAGLCNFSNLSDRCKCFFKSYTLRHNRIKLIYYLRVFYDRPHGIPPQLPQIRIFVTRRGRCGLLGDLLRPGRDGLGGRRAGTRLPRRLRAARHAPAGRQAHRRMEVPRPPLGGGRRGDARLLAADPAGSCRGADTLFPQEKRDKP